MPSTSHTHCDEEDWWFHCALTVLGSLKADRIFHIPLKTFRIALVNLHPGAAAT
jgi:hypothetical protein